MFTGNMMMGGSADNATISYTATATTTADATTYTFSAQAIGTAAADRLVVVGFSCNAGEPATAVTIGGVSATFVVAGDAAGGTAYAALWQAAVPTGTTADIVITFTSTAYRGGIGVWAIYGANSTAYDTGSSIANPLTDTLNIPAGGVAIGYCYDETAGAGSFAWTNLTERFDAALGEGGGSVHSGASDAFAAAQTALTITSTPSSGSYWAMAIASWGP